MPIFYGNGEFFGTLCVVDSKPTLFTQDNIDILMSLSKFFTYVLELETQVGNDPLTGFCNRHYLYRHFDEIINSSDIGTIMFLDLDGFKNINDRFGHETGDIVLKEVARQIKLCLTDTDVAVRLGGDEFILVIPNMSNKSTIEQKAQLILDRINNSNICPYNMDVSTSIGITIYHQDSKDLDTLLRYADMAMYKAKAGGKDNFQFYC